MFGMFERGYDTTEKQWLLTTEQEGDPQPKSAAQQVADARKTASGSGGLGVGVYAIVLVGAAAAFFAFQYLQSSEKK